MIVNLQLGAQKKVCLEGLERVFRGTAKKCDLSENNVNVASDPKVQKVFFNTIEPVSLNIKPCSVTCCSTLESLQNLEFDDINNIKSNVSLCEGNITKLNIVAITNSLNKMRIFGGGIDGAILEAAGPGLLN